jgi:hypothetical protein
MMMIDLSAAPDQVVVGSTFSFPVYLVQEEQEEDLGLEAPGAILVGYSLDVNVLKDPDATGQIIGLAGSTYGDDGAQSNFFLSENFIAADPAGRELHPTLSVINDGHDGGVFIRAIERISRPVGPAAAGHDVLGELVFQVSPDALGFFTLFSGPGTGLIDTMGAMVAYDVEPVTIEVVVPEPGTVFLLAGTVLLVGRRALRH